MALVSSEDFLSVFTMAKITRLGVTEYTMPRMNKNFHWLKFFERKESLQK
jgi:hypothetical protein